MADIWSKRKRSEVMSRIRGEGNQKTELRLARLLRKAGISGWRRHLPIPGRPDFAFRKQKVAVFWPPKTYPRLAILPAPQTYKCASHGDCGWLFLARLPKVFPAAQAESSFLEGED